MIPDSVIEEILGRVSIVDVIGNYLEVKRAGKNHISLCPFHNDKNPSLSISEDKGLYHCFSCGASGNTVKFLMDFKKASFPDAMDELARMAGIDLAKYQTEGEGTNSKEKERLYALNQDAMLYYHRILLDDKNAAKAREYVKGRKLTRESVDTFRLGYGGEGWQGLYDAMRAKGYQDEELEKGSLVSKGKQGYFDRFRERIIFPIFDTSGRVAGFGGRVLGKDAKGAKYLNSSETSVFHKSQLLFALDKARDVIAKSRTALVVEGYMDVIALHQNGVRNAVAALGTAFGESHLRILKRHCEKVVFVFDADAAGLAAANRALDLGVNIDLQQGIVILPPGTDPDDFSMQKGGAAFNKYVEEKMLDPIAFKLRYFARQVDMEKEPLAFLKRVFPFVREMDSPVRREDALKSIALYMGRDLPVILEEFGRAKRPLSMAREEAARPTQTKMDPVELEFLALLVVFPRQAGTVSNIVTPEMLSTEESKTLFEFVKSNSDSKTPELFNRIGDEALRRRASDLANRPDLKPVMLLEVAYKLKLLHLKAELNQTNKAIARMEAENNIQGRNELREAALELVKKRKETQSLLKEIEEKMV